MFHAKVTFRGGVIGVHSRRCSVVHNRARRDGRPCPSHCARISKVRLRRIARIFAHGTRVRGPQLPVRPRRGGATDRDCRCAQGVGRQNHRHAGLRVRCRRSGRRDRQGGGRRPIHDALLLFVVANGLVEGAFKRGRFATFCFDLGRVAHLLRRVRFNAT